MVEELWGEIPVRLGISQAEREAITTLQQVGEGGGRGNSEIIQISPELKTFVQDRTSVQRFYLVNHCGNLEL